MRTTEERKNIRKAIWFVFLTIVAGVILFFVGIPLLARFAAFVSDFKKAGAPITQKDTTPPPPPKFDSLPDFTNQKNIKISGYSESGSTVKITFNGTETDIVAGNDGSFSSDFALLNGENTYSAVATDTSGNTGQATKEYKITYDNKAPDLSISSPSDGAQFFGNRERQQTISGNTEANASVTVNDRVLTVDSNGDFEYTTTLNEGENKFTIKASDEAGNSSEKELTLNFTP